MPQMPVVMLPSARPARAASTAAVTSAGTSASCGWAYVMRSLAAVPDEEAALELRPGPTSAMSAERDQVDALDGRAGEELRARGGAAGERGEVLVLVDTDGPHALLGGGGDAAGAGRAAGAEDHVGALTDELGGVGRALGGCR